MFKATVISSERIFFFNCLCKTGYRLVKQRTCESFYILFVFVFVCFPGLVITDCLSSLVSSASFRLQIYFAYPFSSHRVSSILVQNLNSRFNSS